MIQPREKVLEEEESSSYSVKKISPESPRDFLLKVHFILTHVYKNST